jgi:amino acid adenylation domain-containing protein
MNTHDTLTPIFRKVDFDPFRGPEISQVVPMTASQTEIWLSCTLGGDEGNKAYLESNSLKLVGDLNEAALQEAMHVLIKRHDSLRCSFSGNGKSMIIYTDMVNPILYADLSHLGEPEQAEALRRHLDADANHLFDLVNGPLLKSSLLRLSKEVHLFTFTAHHLIIDGWSVGVIMQELGKIYSARVLGKPHGLPPAKSYSEFAKEQLQFQESAIYHANESFWINVYKDKPPVLNLPTGHVRPDTKSYASSRLEQHLDNTLGTSLRKLAIQANCTFVNVLMTAFEVYLNRLTGQDDIVLGLPASGQASMGYDDLVGHCVNFLPIRSHVDDSLSFRQYLLRRKPEIFDAYEHQQVTFGSILKKLKIPRIASRTPLVPVAFNVDFGLEEGVGFHGLDFEMISNPKAFLNFEIFLNVNGSEKKVVLEWSYNKQIFDEKIMQRYIERFEKWLTFIVSHPDQQIRDFGIVDSTQYRISQESNPVFLPDFSSFKPVNQLIDDAAVQLQDKIAVTCNDQQYTYAELTSLSNQLGHHLKAKGLKKGDIVGIVMDRSINNIAAILGVLKAGGAYLPIDTDFPIGRIEYMLSDAAAFHIVDRRYSQAFDTPSKQIIFDDFLSEKKLYPTVAQAVDLVESDAAYIIYTSGSTGKPKGVVLEHGNLFNFLIIVNQNPGIQYSDKFLAVSSISFDIAILETLLPYVNGAQSYLLDKHQRKDPEQILQQIAAKEITHMFATPSHWKMLLDSKRWTKKFSHFNIISGGEALSKTLAESLLPLSKSVWNIYGPTETTVYSTIKRITEQQEVITIGKPAHNTTVYILDEFLQQVPQGETGELVIAGEGVGRGYLNRPELTAERFMKDPFYKAGDRRMYLTGDLGRYTPEGEIIILGRKDFQVKIRGHRIELGEIEEAISNLDGVKNAVVITKTDQNENSYLVAYVQHEEALISEEGLAVAVSPEIVNEWNTKLQYFLSSYMLPTEYYLLDQFPLTTSGKIDRQTLAQLEALPYTGISFMPRAETPEEKIIAEIWGNALNITNMDITKDFFELGGHSMIAVQVMAQLEKRTNMKLPISVLFEHPTVKGLAKYMKEKGSKNPWNSLVAIKPSGKNTPLYIVHGGGMNVTPFYAIAKHLDPEQPLYALQAYGLNGKDQPLTTIEAIAAQYVSEILHQNPAGPYALAGYSLGGLIAFEMAQQLKKQGKHITALVMFDTYAIRSDHRSPATVRALNLLRREFGKRLFDLKLLFSNPKLLKRLKKDSFKSKANNIRKKLYNQEEETESMQIINKLKAIHIEAGMNYEILHYDGEIYLFRAKTRTNYERDHKYFGWKPYVKKVNVIEMEGEHTTMFDPPNEVNFVKILQAILDESDIKKT